MKFPSAAPLSALFPSLEGASLGLLLAAVAALCPSSLDARVPVNPASLLPGKRVLVINGTETSGDHRNARVALMARMRTLQAEIGFQMDTVSGATPPRTFAALDAYDVIFMNYWFKRPQTQSPTAAFTDFQGAFQQWVNSTNKKRGWLGVHTSGANIENEWNWFRDSVTAMRYFVHTGASQNGTIFRTPDASLHGLPILQGMDTVFTTNDEWYEFYYAPLWGDTANWNANANVRVLYYLNEASLATPLEHPMTPHPMAWIREAPTGNRFFFTSLVHTGSGAGTEFMYSLLLRALEYAAGHSPTSIALNGRNVGRTADEGGAGLYIVNDGTLTLSATEPYVLGVYSLGGERLFQARGRGGDIHRPGALRDPGVYIVRVTAPSGTWARRILVPRP